MEVERMRRLRRLSSVPRWSGVPTLRPQMVDAHSFHVAPIALWLAESHARVGPKKRVDEILMTCLVHDEGEAVYGDVPSPSKRIVGPALKIFDEAKGYGGHPSEDIKVICKCADCLEALIFCEEEKAMGNTSLQYVWDDILNKLDTNWSKFDWDTGRGDKPTARQLTASLWAILHISVHPVMSELQ